MKLHELKPPRGSRKRKQIVGRGPGSGRGKTSCRGENGQGSREGRGTVRGFEGGQQKLIRRIPKVGFRSKNPILYKLVNIAQLDFRFKSGDAVTAEALKENGLIKSVLKPYKLLSNGETKKKFTVQAYSFSKGATEKITSAGGKVEVITKDFFKVTDKKKD